MVTAKKSSTAAADAAPKTKAKAPAKKVIAVPATAAPKTAVKKSPAKKVTPPKTPGTPATVRPAVSAEQRHNYIEVAAFYVAQRRGFAPGNPVDDWAMAEQEVDRLIASGHFTK